MGKCKNSVQSRCAQSRCWVLVVVLSLLVGACRSGGDDTVMEGDVRVRSGGEIVLAVSQWPECLNPLTHCSNSSWLHYSVLDHLLPGLVEYDSDNSLRASPLLLEVPSVDNGGVVVNGDGSFVVTYRLDPDARWSDGEPVTSVDVWFTWRAVLDTEGSTNSVGSGYDLITEVNHDDPHTAVVSYGQPYAPWLYKFTRLLPAHAFDGDTDISGYWNDLIPVSSGPWRQEEWNEERHVLVPNENYWVAERMPLVDRVVMVPREGTEAQVEALKSGVVMAAQPQPFPDVRDRLGDDLDFVTAEGSSIEGLWINQVAPDRRFDVTINVRRALAYALDRERIVEVALGSIVDDPEVLQCAGWSPAFGEWCGDDFAVYQQDVDAVAELLTEDGWTRPDPEGLWVNAEGVELVLQWNTVKDNERREGVQELVREMTEPFGIGWEIINYDPSELFQNRLPKMDFGPVALYAIGASPDPSLDGLYDIDGIPSESNNFSGNNQMAYVSQKASDLSRAVDEELDQSVRMELVAELNALLAQDVPWIPLYTLPQLFIWNSSVLEGAGEWVGNIHGSFRDIYNWTVVE